VRVPHTWYNLSVRQKPHLTEKTKQVASVWWGNLLTHQTMRTGAKMNYIVKLQTAAGEICLGPYSTLFAARQTAAGKGQIVEIFRQKKTAAELQEMTSQELQKHLECDTIRV